YKTEQNVDGLIYPTLIEQLK
ncbi:hypothetical protein, partial [Acinetobacter seifertii]